MIDFQDAKPATWIIFMSLAILIGGILYLGYSSKGGIKPIHWIAVAVICGGVATLFKEAKSSETTQLMKATGEDTNKEVKVLRDENKELREKLHENQITLKAQTQSIDILRQENERLTNKTNEIHTQTTDIHSNITGYDSFCYVDINIYPFAFAAGVAPVAIINLKHIGKYPLKNIQVSIICTDYSFDDKKRIHFDSPPRGNNSSLVGYQGNPYTQSVPVISSNESIQLHQMDIILKPQKSFNICIRSDNGLVLYQRTLIRQIKDFSNALLPPPGAETREMCIPISQIYLTRKLTFAEELKAIENAGDQSFVFPRAEIIIREGANYMLNSEFAIGPRNNRWLRWKEFPYLVGESEPFSSFDKLHWDGQKNSVVVYGGPTITEYLPISK